MVVILTVHDNSICKYALLKLYIYTIALKIIDTYTLFWIKMVVNIETNSDSMIIILELLI